MDGPIQDKTRQDKTLEPRPNPTGQAKIEASPAQFSPVQPLPALRATNSMYRPTAKNLYVSESWRIRQSPTTKREAFP